MANFSIKADLLKLRGAFMMNIKGKTAVKRCLCIPVDEAGVFVGEKGVYLNMTAVAMQEPKYGDTHFVKVNLDRDSYNALTEEERRAIPILGGMRELEQRSQVITTQTFDASAAQGGDGNPGDDLPF